MKYSPPAPTKGSPCPLKGGSPDLGGSVGGVVDGRSLHTLQVTEVMGWEPREW